MLSGTIIHCYKKVNKATVPANGYARKLYALGLCTSFFSLTTGASSCTDSTNESVGRGSFLLSGLLFESYKQHNQRIPSIDLILPIVRPPALPRVFQEMPSIIISSVAGAAAFYVFLLVLAYYKHDPKEPKAIVGTIPFFSPLIGMLTQKGHYYIRLRFVCLHSILAVKS